MQLKHSIVMRGGEMAANWYGEPKTKNIRSSSVPKGLSVRFELSSKGGGRTAIELTVGIKDLRPLLIEVAKDHPRLADTFAECAQIAVLGLLKSRS